MLKDAGIITEWLEEARDEAFSRACDELIDRALLAESVDELGL
ncbi:MAG: hypothetical protein ACK47B_15985 [Armatimonadota bacterium]